jgi:hypothetical protein
MTRRLLIDPLPIQLQLIEAEGGKLRVKGEFARVDRATENKRRYTKGLMERELKRLFKPIGERKVLGELDHPSDGRTQLTRVSHVITTLHFDDDGSTIIGEAEPLDTTRGKDLQALLKSGVKIGVSSRGYGSTKANDQGEEVVQDDYKLVTFDFVAEPADSTAYPEVVYEEKDPMIDPSELTAETLKQAHPTLYAEVAKVAAAECTASLKEEFSRNLLDAVGKVKTEVQEQVRSELLADPMVAGAKQALDAVEKPDLGVAGDLYAASRY